jgi:hypothetical protein
MPASPQPPSTASVSNTQFLPESEASPSGRRNEVGELSDHGELLCAIKRPRVREHLHPDVVAVSREFDSATCGRSWTNAVVFCRNIGMSAVVRTRHGVLVFNFRRMGYLVSGC